MEQYKKDLVARYWNDKFEQQLEKMLADNPSMVELFKKYPERKEAYKFKILDSQPLEPSSPPPDNIPCKTCRFRLPAIMAGGKLVDRHTVPHCMIYEQPEAKPYEILRDGEPCEYYEKDNRKLEK